MKIGYQLYSAKDYCTTGEGILRTISILAEQGYDGVELFDYCDLKPEELKYYCETLGIEIINSHVQYERWLNNCQGEIDFAKAAGIKSVTFPWLEEGKRTDSGYKQLFADLGTISEKVVNSGITFYYHNHDFELEKLDGELVLDQIANVSKNINLQIDTFWVKYAGYDPLSFIDKYKDRIGFTHFKDFVDDSITPPMFCALGEGKMDNERLIARCEALGQAWLVVEQDNSQIDVFESSLISLKNIKKMLCKQA